MAAVKIPTVLNNFNVYGNGSKYIGVASELTLPNLEHTTETLDGAGIGGEIEEPVEGTFGSLESETTFLNISKDLFNFASQTGTLTYRGSMQVLNTSTQVNEFVPVVVTMKGKTKAIDLGSFKKGGKGEPKITREVTYLKITYDGTTLVELDKYNLIYKLNGTDMLSTVRSQI